VRRIFVFVNTMYYTLALLLVTCLAVFTLVTSAMLQPLTGIMLLLVYLGAMIILIGYICAVSPNFIIVSFSNLFASRIVAAVGLISLSFTPLTFVAARSVRSPLPFFFRRHGLFVFTVIALILFITLLMVTSQYFSPKGPFRSVL